MSYTAEFPIGYIPNPDKFGALAGGDVYFGVPNGNPASVPADRIQVYLARQGLADLAIAQPIDIGPGGVWYYNGSPAQIKVLVPYCVQILSSLGVQKYYAPAAGDEIAKFNALDAIVAVAVKTVATFADISAALTSATIGQQISLLGHTSPNIGGGIFDVVSAGALVTDTGTTVVNGAKAAVRQNQSPLTPQMFGALGNIAGPNYADVTAAHDDTQAFKDMFAKNMAWEIPWVLYGYKITDKLSINSDGKCYANLRPTTAIGALTNDYDRFCVVIEESGYPVKRRIEGLKVEWNVTVRAAGVNGIRNDCYNAILVCCSAPQLNFGIVARSFSQTYLKCNAWQCNTNLSAYARDASHEINTLTIDGGNYDTPVNKSAVI